MTTQTSGRPQLHAIPPEDAVQFCVVKLETPEYRVAKYSIFPPTQYCTVTSASVKVYDPPQIVEFSPESHRLNLSTRTPQRFRDSLAYKVRAFSSGPDSVLSRSATSDFTSDFDLLDSSSIVGSEPNAVDPSCPVHASSDVSRESSVLYSVPAVHASDNNILTESDPLDSGSRVRVLDNVLNEPNVVSEQSLIGPASRVHSIDIVPNEPVVVDPACPVHALNKTPPEPFCTSSMYNPSVVTPDCPIHASHSISPEPADLSGLRSNDLLSLSSSTSAASKSIGENQGHVDEEIEQDEVEDASTKTMELESIEIKQEPTDCEPHWHETNAPEVSTSVVREDTPQSSTSAVTAKRWQFTQGNEEGAPFTNQRRPLTSIPVEAVYRRAQEQSFIPHSYSRDSFTQSSPPVDCEESFRSGSDTVSRVDQPLDILGNTAAKSSGSGALDLLFSETSDDPDQAIAEREQGDEASQAPVPFSDAREFQTSTDTQEPQTTSGTSKLFEPQIDFQRKTIFKKQINPSEELTETEASTDCSAQNCIQKVPAQPTTESDASTSTESLGGTAVEAQDGAAFQKSKAQKEMKQTNEAKEESTSEPSSPEVPKKISESCNQDDDKTSTPEASSGNQNGRILKVVLRKQNENQISRSWKQDGKNSRVESRTADDEATEMHDDESVTKSSRVVKSSYQADVSGETTEDNTDAKVDVAENPDAADEKEESEDKEIPMFRTRLNIKAKRKLSRRKLTEVVRRMNKSSSGIPMINLSLDPVDCPGKKICSTEGNGFESEHRRKEEDKLEPSAGKLPMKRRGRKKRVVYSSKEESSDSEAGKETYRKKLRLRKRKVISDKRGADESSDTEPLSPTPGPTKYAPKAKRTRLSLRRKRAKTTDALEEEPSQSVVVDVRTKVVRAEDATQRRDARRDKSVSALYTGATKAVIASNDAPNTTERRYPERTSRTTRKPVEDISQCGEMPVMPRLSEEPSVKIAEINEAAKTREHSEERKTSGVWQNVKKFKLKPCSVRIRRIEDKLMSQTETAKIEENSSIKEEKEEQETRKNLEPRNKELDKFVPRLAEEENGSGKETIKPKSSTHANPLFPVEKNSLRTFEKDVTSSDAHEDLDENVRRARRRRISSDSDFEEPCASKGDKPGDSTLEQNSSDGLKGHERHDEGRGTTLSTCHMAKCGQLLAGELGAAVDRVFVAFRDDCATVHFQDSEGKGPERYSVTFDSTETETVVHIARKRTLGERPRETNTKKDKTGDATDKNRKEKKDDKISAAAVICAKKRTKPKPVTPVEESAKSNRNLKAKINSEKESSAKKQDSKLKESKRQQRATLSAEDEAVDDVIEILKEVNVERTVLPVFTSTFSLTDRNRAN